VESGLVEEVQERGRRVVTVVEAIVVVECEEGLL
jgi:hypothetical protein